MGQPEPCELDPAPARPVCSFDSCRHSVLNFFAVLKAKHDIRPALCARALCHPTYRSIWQGWQENRYALGKANLMSAVAVRNGDVGRPVAEPASLALNLLALGAGALQRRPRLPRWPHPIHPPRKGGAGQRSGGRE